MNNTFGRVGSDRSRLAAYAWLAVVITNRRKIGVLVRIIG
jgi:hypothetical protein